MAFKRLLEENGIRGRAGSSRHVAVSALYSSANYRKYGDTSNIPGNCSSSSNYDSHSRNQNESSEVYFSEEGYDASLRRPQGALT